MAKSKKSDNMAVAEGEHMSVSVRKIHNGYVVSHSKSTPKGYESTEVFHAKKPNVTMAGVPEGDVTPKESDGDSPKAMRKAAGKKPKDT